MFGLHAQGGNRWNVALGASEFTIRVTDVLRIESSAEFFSACETAQVSRDAVLERLSTFFSCGNNIRLN